MLGAAPRHRGTRPCTRRPVRPAAAPRRAARGHGTPSQRCPHCASPARRGGGIRRREMNRKTCHSKEQGPASTGCCRGRGGIRRWQAALRVIPGDSGTDSGASDSHRRSAHRLTTPTRSSPRSTPRLSRAPASRSSASSRSASATPTCPSLENGDDRPVPRVLGQPAPVLRPRDQGDHVRRGLRRA